MVKNQESLIFQTKSHKLLFPILSTFFKKRRDLVVLSRIKEQRAKEYNKMRSKWRSNFFSKNIADNQSVITKKGEKSLPGVSYSQSIEPSNVHNVLEVSNSVQKQKKGNIYGSVIDFAYFKKRDFETTSIPGEKILKESTLIIANHL